MNALLSPAAAVGAVATLGVADFAGGVAGRRTSAPSVTVGIAVCGLVALPLAMWFLPIRWDLQAAIFAFAGSALISVCFALISAVSFVPRRARGVSSLWAAHVTAWGSSSIYMQPSMVCFRSARC